MMMNLGHVRNVQEPAGERESFARNTRWRALAVEAFADVRHRGAHRLAHPQDRCQPQRRIALGPRVLGHGLRIEHEASDGAHTRDCRSAPPDARRDGTQCPDRVCGVGHRHDVARS